MTEFSDFWLIAKRWRGSYSNPRGGRGGAEQAWNRAIMDGADPDEIVEGAQGYVDHIQADDVESHFVCMASTFLNQARWEQYADIAVEARARAAEALLERRRAYYRYGWRDARTGAGRLRTDIVEPEVQEAYDQGWRDGAPKLEVVR